MFMLHVDLRFLTDFGDGNWRQAEAWNSLPARGVEVLMLRSGQT